MSERVEGAGDASRSELPEGLLFGLGNPLLDITANVDLEFLKKYHMNPNDAILGGEYQTTLTQDMLSKYQNIEYSAGGSCLNSFRIAQWHLKKPNVVTNTGCIGHDDFGRILQEKAKEAGVNVQLQIDPQEKTGSCAVLVTGSNKLRSLCAFLNAANCFKIDHIHKPELKALIEKARYFYTTGYFLVVSLPSLLEVANHALEKNKVFCFNLSAGYVLEFYKNSVEQLLPYVDVIFGNDQEFSAFATAFGIESKDMKEVARLVQGMSKKNSQRKRIVIITRGADSVVVCNEKSEIQEFPAKRIPDSEIAETNGAGDGFVGGFLSQFIQGYPLDRCVACGHYTASEVIKQHGVKVPNEPHFVYEKKSL